MQPHLAELFGVLAAAASLYAAQSKTIIALRAAAIANFLAMIYSFMHGTYPTFALNAVLLPLNGWRLQAMIKLIRNIDVATKGDMNAEWLLPYTRPKNFKPGQIIMKRGIIRPRLSTSSPAKSKLWKLRQYSERRLAWRNWPVHSRWRTHNDCALQVGCPKSRDRL